MKFYDIIKNVIETKAYADPRTLEADPLMGFRFRVSIDKSSDNIMGFQKVSGISKELAVIDYFENTYDFAHKLPGRQSVGEVTFEKGMYADKKFADYYESLLTEKETHDRHTVTVGIYDRFGTLKRTFTFNNCWFSKYEVSDLDASSDDVLIETLTMPSEGLDTGQAS